MKPIDFVIKAKVNRYIRKRNIDAIKDLLLTHPHPEKIVDELTAFELEGLPGEILKRSVTGYSNLYDYILKEKKYNTRPDKESIRDTELALTWYINKGSLDPGMMTDEVLLSTLPDGTRLLDDALDNYTFYFNTPNIKSKELIMRLYEKGEYSFFVNSCLDTLKTKLPSGKLLIEEMIARGILPNTKFIIKGKNQYVFDGFFSPTLDVLLEKVKGDKTILDLIIEAGVVFSFKFDLFPSSEEKDKWKQIYLTCSNHNRYDLLIGDLPEEFLFMDVNGTKPIDVLNSLNVPFGILGKVTNMDMLKRLANNEHMHHEILLKTPVRLLTTEITSTKRTALDYIISLAVLHEKEYSLTIKDVINTLYQSGKMNDDVVLIFARYNIFLTPLDNQELLGLNKNQRMDKFIYNSSSVYTGTENHSLVYRFRKAFFEDGNSPVVVDSIVDSFNRYYLESPEEAIRDLEAIIDYKEGHPKFILKNDVNMGSSFLPCRYENSSGDINLQFSRDISGLNHEWAHLLHYAYGNYKTPEEIKCFIPYDSTFGISHLEDAIDIKDRVFADADLLLDDNNMSKEFCEYVNLTKGGIENYQMEIEKEYRDLIGSRGIVLDALKHGGFSNDTLVALMGALIGDGKDDYLSEDNVQKYVKNRIVSEYETFKKIYYKKTNSDFLLYENFIDAYYGGAIGDLSQVDKKSKAPLCTHNSSYFRREGKQFSEMFADYVAIKKLPNGSMYIEKLKEMTSPELIEAIDNYYHSLSREKSSTRM